MTHTSPDTNSKSALLAWIKDPARSPAELATGFFPDADRAIAARADFLSEVPATRSHWLVRLGVTLHPDASDAMLELLSADTDADVAAAARQKRAARATG